MTKLATNLRENEKFVEILIILYSDDLRYRISLKTYSHTKTTTLPQVLFVPIPLYELPMNNQLDLHLSVINRSMYPYDFMYCNFRK